MNATSPVKTDCRPRWECCSKGREGMDVIRLMLEGSA